MTIPKYNEMNSLYSSEVYRELERQALKKGFFNLTEKEANKNIAKDIVTQASNIEEKIQSSDSFIQDISRLVYAMKRKGFTAQAEEIEDNFKMYKKTESEFYNLNMEDNNNFLDFAHREGEVKMFDFPGDLGNIETLETQQKKMISTIKDPTGKQAALKEIAGLIKNAQTSYESLDSTPFGEDKSVEKSTLKKTLKADSTQAVNLLKKIANDFAKINNIKFDDTKITLFQIPGDVEKGKVFSRLGGDLNQVKKLWNVLATVYAGKPQNTNTISNAIFADPSGYLGKVNSVLGTQYKVANIFKKKLKKESQVALMSPGGILPAAAIAGPAAAGSALTKAVMPFFTPEKETIDRNKAVQIANSIFAAVTQLKTQVEKIFMGVDSKLNEVKSVTGKVVSALKDMASWNLSNDKDIYNFAVRIKGAIPQLKGELARIGYIFDGFGLQEVHYGISSNIEILDTVASSMINSLSKFKGKANIRDTAGRVRAIYNKLRKFVEGKKELQTEGRMKTLRSLGVIYDAITNNDFKGEAAILKTIGGGYKSWEDLDADTMQLEKMVNKDIASYRGV